MDKVGVDEIVIDFAPYDQKKLCEESSYFTRDTPKNFKHFNLL
jgi:hypothetical protein